MKFSIEPRLVVCMSHLEHWRFIRWRWSIKCTYIENKHYDMKHQQMLFQLMLSQNHILHNVYVENVFRDMLNISIHCWMDRIEMWLLCYNQHTRNIRARKEIRIPSSIYEENQWSITWYCFPSNSVIPERTREKTFDDANVSWKRCTYEILLEMNCDIWYRH